MLKRFSVENYKNFQEKVELAFDSARDYGFNLECVRDGLLNKVLVVGKNGCGKTNLGLALFDIVYTLTNKMSHPMQTDVPSFINGDSNMGYATFVYEFKFGESVFRYEYRKTAPMMIIYESLVADGQTVFVRDGTRTDTSGLSRYGAGSLSIGIGDGPLSVLRYIFSNTPQKDDSPISRIMRFVEGMLYFRSDHAGNMFIGLHQNAELLSQYIIDNGLVRDFARSLKKAGGLDVDLEVVRNNGMPGILVQRFRKNKLLFDNVASSGAKTYMLYYYWYKHFKDVTFLYMDEFDAYYHFEMAKNVMRSVISMTDIQTVFTSHNIALVTNDLLRPDGYMLLENGVLKNFPDRTDREIREGHNIEKMYRNGEFDG